MSFKDGIEMLTKIIEETVAPMPTFFVKYGDEVTINNLLFAKFCDQDERDEAIQKVKSKTTEGLWVKADLPAETRAVNGFLLGLKYLLSQSDWGYEKREVKVDLDDGVLKVGGEFVVSVRFPKVIEFPGPDAFYKMSSVSCLQAGIKRFLLSVPDFMSEVRNPVGFCSCAL